MVKVQCQRLSFIVRDVLIICLNQNLILISFWESIHFCILYRPNGKLVINLTTVLWQSIHTGPHITIESLVMLSKHIIECLDLVSDQHINCIDLWH